MKNDQTYLTHVQEALDWIAKYTAEGKPAFLADRRTQDAVLRNLEIIGEAVKQVSEEVKGRHPGVPWRQIAGLRDKLVHEYFGVNLELIWEVVSSELPVLRDQIGQMLTDMD